MMMTAVVCAALSLLSQDTVEKGRVQWTTDEPAAFEKAKKEDKLVVVHFWATWCGPCKQMEKETFADESVAAFQNAHFVNVALDVDRFAVEADRYGVDSIPATFLVTPSGERLGEMVGPVEPAGFLGKLRAAREGAAKLKELLARAGEAPQDAAVRREIAKIYLSMGAKRSAEEHFEKFAGLLGAKASLTGEERRGLVEALVEITSIRLDADDTTPETLRRDAQRLERADPKGEFGGADDSLFARAMADERDERADDAIAKLQSLLERFPASNRVEEGTLWIGYLLVQVKKEREKGLKVLQDFLKQYPESPLRGAAEHLIQDATGEHQDHD